MTPVLKYIADHESRFVGELIELSRFPSVSAQAKHRADVEVGRAAVHEVGEGVADADIYAAIDSVRPAGSIIWARIS